MSDVSSQLKWNCSKIRSASIQSAQHARKPPRQTRPDCAVRQKGGEGEGMLTHVPTASHRPSILSPWKSIPEQQTPRQTSFRLSHAANLFTLNHAKQVGECACVGGGGGMEGGGLHAQVHWPSMGIHLSTNSPSSMKRVLREEPLGENTNGKGVRSLTGRKKIGKKKKEPASTSEQRGLGHFAQFRWCVARFSTCELDK